MSANLNRGAQMLRRATTLARSEDRRNYCLSCQRTVEPRIDSRGPYCPWCHQDIPTAMERGREHTT